MNEELRNLLNEQLTSWKMAQKNYDVLRRVRVKEVGMNGCLYKMQFNPTRIVPSAAEVDNKLTQERKRFLCPTYLPPMQKRVPFGGHHRILVNPSPILPKHLTIPELQHTDQRILYRFTDMLDPVGCAEDYIVFYNGPQCSVSAPGHIHFQASSRGFLPTKQGWKEKRAEKIITNEAATLWVLGDSPRTTSLIESESKKTAVALFDAVYGATNLRSGEEGSTMNVSAWEERGKQIVCIFPRVRHRPVCYMAQGNTNILISPASVDMGSVFITPSEKDFEKITVNDIANILSEACLKPANFRTLIERIKQRS